ncbi:hypothetical protein FRB90_007598 [Tulasnella sp. 427]|nr:hypothetical protein FRB90_007598 [Tulasnella sp. 427]
MARKLGIASWHTISSPTGSSNPPAKKLRFEEMLKSDPRWVSSSDQLPSKDEPSTVYSPPTHTSNGQPTFVISTTSQGETSLHAATSSTVENPADYILGPLEGGHAEFDSFEGDPLLLEDCPSVVLSEDDDNIEEFEMNCGAASYYDTMALFTDAVNTRELKNCNSQFLSCTREWKVLEIMMRACSRDGTDLQAGEGAVQCPICPIPGVNLPDNWKEDPDADLLYRVFYSFDGNFSLQLNDKGVTEDVDPSTIGDAGHWVERAKSLEYIEKLGGFEDQKGKRCGGDGEDSPCQHMRAGKASKAKAAEHKLVPGVVACCCARHNMMLANGTVDLWHGERYPNTDCCVMAALKAAHGLNTAFLTYDIWCKYSVNLEKHLEAGGMPSFSELELQVLRAIPKFHIGAHGAGCYPKYSLNFMENVGRTHGERVEQAWADLGKAKFTCEMTPGHQKETLTGMFGHHNWKILCKDDIRLEKAIYEARRQIIGKEENLAAIEVSIGDALLLEFQEWDKSHPRVEKYASNYRDIKQLIAVKSWFKRSLSKHYQDLLLHAPLLSHLDISIPSSQNLHMAKLHLPSSFTPAERQLFNLESLAGLEQELRIPQAQQEVTNIRNALGIKAFVVCEGRQATTTGQTGYAVLSRSQGWVKQAEEQVNCVARSYRRMFQALQALGTKFGVGTSAGALQELLDSDLHIVSNWTVEDVGKKGGTGSQVKASSQPIPWLWKSFGGGLVSKEDSQDQVEEKIKQYNHQVQPAIHVEWVTARAALFQWKEDEKLLKKELRRIGAYCWWKAKDLQKSQGEALSPGLLGWLEKKRRMWEAMAVRAEQTHDRVKKQFPFYQVQGLSR